MPIMLALFFIFLGFAGGVAAGIFLAKKDFEDRFDEEHLNICSKCILEKEKYERS